MDSYHAIKLSESTKQVKELAKVLVGTLTLCANLALRPFIIIRIGRIRSDRIRSIVDDLDRHLA